MWVSSLSELVPVDPSGSVTHWKNFTGEGGEGDGRGTGGERGEALFPVPMPMCSSQGATVHILSE